MPREIDYLGEGRSDEAVARALIAAAGHIPGRSYLRPHKGTGKASLDRRLEGLNRGAEAGRIVLVIRDLDDDASCGSALVGKLLAQRHPHMLLRVAVPTAEAWLLADRTAYAQCCGVKQASVPDSPEAERNLKQAVLRIALHHPSSRLAKHVATCRGRGMPDWQTLGEWHAAFASEVWRPARAVQSGRSRSLARALSCLSRLT